MKFTFAIQKMGKGEMAIARGHNCRTHPTRSQLDQGAWFSEKGSGYAVKWNDSKVKLAEGLAKRKDAVVGIEFVVQVGNQTDWREPPSTEHPEGKPKPISRELQQGMCLAVKEWAEQTFGAENVVGIHLHLDESTPHVHAVVTPIKDGKLQAKAWLNGGASVAALRRSCHAAMNARIPCSFTPYGLGGKPHREDLRAGMAPVPTMLDKMTGHARARELEQQNAALREENEQLKQARFSRQKTQYRAEMAAAAEKALEDAAKAVEGHKSAVMALLNAEVRVQQLQETIQQQANEIKTVRAYNAKLADDNNELLDKIRELSPSRDFPGARR